MPNNEYVRVRARCIDALHRLSSERKIPPTGCYGTRTFLNSRRVKVREVREASRMDSREEIAGEKPMTNLG